MEWIEDGELRGVYIPEETSSKLAHWQEELFPGVHHLAKFSVNESDGNYKVAFVSDDETSLSIEANETNNWNSESVFG